MTLEQLQSIPFRFYAHLNMGNTHQTQYVNEEYGIVILDVTNMRTYKTRRYYRYKGKEYKSVEALAAALEGKKAAKCLPF